MRENNPYLNIKSRVLEGDEVKIYPHKRTCLHFDCIGTDKNGKNIYGKISNIGYLIKTRGVVLEDSYDKKLEKWTYFCEFFADKDQRYWFLEDEIYLI